MSKLVVLKPRISEKSYGLSQKQVYVFQVPKSTNREAVAKAIAMQFDVTVTGVNITIAKGKAKRTIKKGGRQVHGQRSDMKKAYVTLKDGDQIAVFAAEDEKADEKTKSKAKAKKESK